MAPCSRGCGSNTTVLSEVDTALTAAFTGATEPCEDGVATWEKFCPTQAWPFCKGNDGRTCQDVGAKFDHLTSDCDDTDHKCWTGRRAKCKKVRTCCAGYDMVKRGVWSCHGVPCPKHSTGASVPSGCSCDPGYAGDIEATVVAPYYSGSCSAAPCPAHSSGANIPCGCRCIAGFNGSITASSSLPYYTGHCEPLPCPALSVGANLASGCSCVPGAAGRIKLIGQTSYRGSCVAVPCPANSKPKVEGLGLVGGCVCTAGFNGTITAIRFAPYYDGRCSQLDSPVFSMTLYVCIALGLVSTLLAIVGQISDKLRHSVAMMLLWVLSGISCGLILVPSVNDDGVLYLGPKDGAAVFAEAISVTDAKRIVTTDILSLVTFVVISAAWSCCWTRPGGRGISTAIFAVTSGLLVEGALRKEGAHEDVVVGGAALWGTMFIILAVDSVPLPWPLQQSITCQASSSSTTRSHPLLGASS